MLTRTGALYIFDYFLTLADEVKYFWGKELSTASVLFYLSRYLVLVNSVKTIALSYIFHLHGQVRWFLIPYEMILSILAITEV